MAEEIKITTAADYRKKHVKTKMVKTPNGAVFKIRPISPLDYVNERIPLMKNKDDEKGSRVFVKAILLTCVLEPNIVEENPKENELLIEEVAFDDYQFLIKEITDYSVSKNSDFLATGQSSSG